MDYPHDPIEVCKYASEIAYNTGMLAKFNTARIEAERKGIIGYQDPATSFIPLTSDQYRYITDEANCDGGRTADQVLQLYTPDQLCSVTFGDVTLFNYNVGAEGANRLQPAELRRAQRAVCTAERKGDVGTGAKVGSPLTAIGNIGMQGAIVGGSSIPGALSAGLQLGNVAAGAAGQQTAPQAKKPRSLLWYVGGAAVVGTIAYLLWPKKRPRRRRLR